MTEPFDEPDETLGLLDSIEQFFRRMISGMFHFVFVRLWSWLYEIFKDFFDWLVRFLRYTSKVLFRLIRVFFFASIWAICVFGPTAAGFSADTRNPTWGILGIAWAAITLIGSIYGLYRRAKRRRALLGSATEEVIPEETIPMAEFVECT